MSTRQPKTDRLRSAGAMRPSRCAASQRAVPLAVWMLGVFLAGCGDSGNLPRTEQTVDGMTIYLGVVPAELVQGHPTEPSDPKTMHGGTAKDVASHHIVVALFDAKTGARITDARIRAGVGDRSYSHEPTRSLEPMLINGTVTYGNFFLMQGRGVWRIHLEIQRPGVARTTEANFAYEHVPGP